MKQVYVPTNKAGVTYYMRRRLALTPFMADGELVMPFSPYWVTWGEDKDGNEIPLSRTFWPRRPQ